MQEQDGVDQRYRRYYLEADKRQVAAGMLFWILGIAGFAGIDYTLFGFSPVFFFMAALRIVYIGLTALTVFRLLPRIQSPEVFDRLVFWWSMASVGISILVNVNIGYVSVQGLMIDFVIILTFYSFVPNRRSIRMIAPLLLTFYDLATAITSDPPLQQSIITVLVFSHFGINFLGYIFSERLHTFRHKEFLSHLEEETIRSELERLASTDPLTNVLNRRRLLELAGEAFYRYRRYGRPFSVMLMDLDGFKLVNDTFGHHQGDAVLVQFAQAVAGEKRELDALGRMGGDEFCLVLPETVPEAAGVLAERIINACSTWELNDTGKQVQVTVSIGVSQVQPEDASLDAVFARADTALYQSKNQGRNRWSML